VDFKNNNWNLWRLMQHAAYIISQGLPRLHQSMVTHKVSCLPGCCQLIKICEETCGDEVLRHRFGRCPKPDDSMLKHLRASYSEDRNHVCNLLTARPHVQTRQALGALAITDVPTSFSVFLSQRKRWSLGATVNDLFLLTSKGTQWFERIRAFSNVLTWFHDIFILGSIAGLVVTATRKYTTLKVTYTAKLVLDVPWFITTSFMAGVLIPYIYMLTLVAWFPKTTKSKFQYLAGIAIYWIVGPFLTVTILLYSLWHLNHFAWGKTRKVVFEESASSSTLNENTRPKDEESRGGFGGEC
jgi:chitin synthase